MTALVIGVQGDDKSGKSSFALSAPKPIFHMGLDVGGFYRASHRYRDDIAAGRIANREYPLKQQALMDGMFSKFKRPHRLMGMTELWFDEFLTDYYSALMGETPPGNDGKTKPFLAPCGEPYQSVIMDNAALVWSLDCAAFLQEKQEAQGAGERPREKLQQMEYAEPNARFRALVNSARAVGKNLVLLQPIVAETKKMLVEGKLEDVETGRMLPAGWRYTTQTVDLMIETVRSVNKKGENSIVAKVVLSGMALELNGVELPTPDWTAMESMVKMFRGED